MLVGNSATKQKRRRNRRSVSRLRINRHQKTVHFCAGPACVMLRRLSRFIHAHHAHPLLPRHLYAPAPAHHFIDSSQTLRSLSA